MYTLAEASTYRDIFGYEISHSGNLLTFSGGVVNVNGLKLSPRIVLMTDGKPTGTTEVQV